MTTHRWPRRCKSKSPGDWGVNYWEQLHEGAEVAMYCKDKAFYKSQFKSIDQLLKNHGASGVYEVFDHLPPKYPRRAAQKVREGVYKDILFWEQIAPDAEITVHHECGVKNRSCWTTFDSLLKDNAGAGVVEVFDHHNFPRYFEESQSRGLRFRRKFTSVENAVWADGMAPEYNLCSPHNTLSALPHGGHYDSLGSLIASGKFIEVDADGVAMDGSDKVKTVDTPEVDDRNNYSFEIQKRQARIETLEAELYKKDCAADVFRKDIADRDATIKTQQKHIDAYRKEAGSFGSCLARADAEVVRLRNERDNLDRKYKELLGCYIEMLESLHSVFQGKASKPAILPNFVLPGDKLSAAVVRLAQEYVMVRNERDSLLNLKSRNTSAADYANLQFDRLRYALNDIVKFARKNPTETDLDIVRRVFGERDALSQSVQKMRDALK